MCIMSGTEVGDVQRPPHAIVPELPVIAGHGVLPAAAVPKNFRLVHFCIMK
jgi:hypothetical protein